MENPDHPVVDRFVEAQERGLVGGACSACAEAFDATEEIQAAEVELLGDRDHGPSVGELTADGYDLLTIG